MKVRLHTYDNRHKNKVKLHNFDTWNVDFTLALIIVPLLKQYKKTNHGSPLVDNEDVPKKLHRPKGCDWAYSGDTDKNWHKRWNYVLDEMIWAFEHLDSMDHVNMDASDWKKQIEKHEKRVDNGLRLFGKYYRSLWD